MEQVMVVRKEILEQHGFIDETSLIEDTSDVLKAIQNSYEYIPRVQAEEDFSYKQIIPYVVIHWGNSFLLLRRLGGQSETRLHGKLSIGVGGHINDTDGEIAEDMIIKGMYRELNEEVRVEYSRPPEFIGFVNNTENNVSRVHLGLVYVLTSDSADIEILEKDKMEGRWATIDELEAEYIRLETWSQIVLKYIKNICK